MSCRFNFACRRADGPLLNREQAAVKAQAVALDVAMLYQSNVARFTGFVTALGHAQRGMDT